MVGDLVMVLIWSTFGRFDGFPMLMLELDSVDTAGRIGTIRSYPMVGFGLYTVFQLIES